MKNISIKISLILVLLLNVLITNNAQTQTKENVNFGDTLNKVLSMGFQYLYPEFKTGTVHFTTNEKSTASLNYNILLNEIHFIDNKGINKEDLKTENDFFENSMSLDLTDISHVTIGDDYFINTNRGIMYLIMDTDQVKLLRNDAIKMSGQSNIGAYGMQSQTSSVERRSSTPSERARRGSDFKQEVVTEYSRETRFYLLTENRIRNANQKGFEKTFRDKRDEIRDFVDKNKIDFEDENDLIELLRFSIQ